MPTYLKLGNHKLTGGRQPVQQLRCVGGEICNLVNVTYVVCFSDEIGRSFCDWPNQSNLISHFLFRLAGSTRWSCEHKELPDFVDFDNISVSCENSNVRDEVIGNSCHMNYSLQLPTERLDSIPSLMFRQLTCVGDKNLCDEYAPSTVDCKIVGFSNGNVKWKCFAILGSNVEFNDSQFNVSCEDAPYLKNADNVIIQHSCRLR